MRHGTKIYRTKSLAKDYETVISTRIVNRHYYNFNLNLKFVNAGNNSLKFFYSKSFCLIAFVILTILVAAYAELAKVLAQAGGKVIATITVEDSPLWATYNPGNGLIYVPNDGSDSVTVIEKDNEVIDTVNVGDFPFSITYNGGNKYLYVVNSGEPGAGTVSVIGTLIPPFSGILESGNNINIQSQENSGDIVIGQPSFGGTYSDSPILQGQTTEQDSQLVS